MRTIYNLQSQKPIWFHCAKTLISLYTNETTETTILSIETRLFWQECLECFENPYNRFFAYLIINDTVSWAQSTLSLTGCRIFCMLDLFPTYHPSLHESVAMRQRIHVGMDEMYEIAQQARYRLLVIDKV